MFKDGRSKKVVFIAHCFLNQTSDDNAKVESMGLFMEKISYRLSKKDLFIPMIGLKGSDNITEKLYPIFEQSRTTKQI